MTQEIAMKTKTKLKAGQGVASKSLDAGVDDIWDDWD